MADWLRLIIIPAFVAFWCGGCLLLGRLGGWSRLASRFPAVTRPSGQRFRFAAAKIGMASYDGVLTAIKSEGGLYLSVALPWRLGHSAIFIPWSEMRDCETQKVLWSEWIQVRVLTPHPVGLRVPVKLVSGKLPTNAQQSAEL